MLKVNKKIIRTKKITKQKRLFFYKKLNEEEHELEKKLKAVRERKKKVERSIQKYEHNLSKHEYDWESKLQEAKDKIAQLNHQKLFAQFIQNFLSKHQEFLKENYDTVEVLRTRVQQSNTLYFAVIEYILDAQVNGFLEVKKLKNQPPTPNVLANLGHVKQLHLEAWKNSNVKDIITKLLCDNVVPIEVTQEKGMAEKLMFLRDKLKQLNDLKEEIEN